MEEQLFSWESFDVLDTMCFVFYKVKTKIKILSWDVGTSFDYAEVNYHDGTVEFGQDEGQIYRVKFKMVVTLQEPAMETVAHGILGEKS